MNAVHRQRQTLCDLLDSLTDAQWAAETTCDGWDAGDMVAHLLVREREPWASLGLLIPPLAGIHAARMKSKKKDGRASMMTQLRDGPPWLATKSVIGRVQIGEDYIHTEDVRRGGAATITDDSTSDLTQADLTPDDGTGDEIISEALWAAVGRFALQTFGGIKADGVIALTDGSRTRAYKVGGRFARPAPDARPDQTATVNGPVGELLLFTTGRTVARVEVTGSQAVIDAVSGSGRKV